MDSSPCPQCGSAAAIKFDSTSDWCEPCVQRTLVEQDALAHAPEDHQYFSEV